VAQNAALANPEIKARLGGIAFPGSPADFGKWAKVIRAANIKPE
jgi:hypothetical protein